MQEISTPEYIPDENTCAYSGVQYRIGHERTLPIIRSLLTLSVDWSGKTGDSRRRRPFIVALRTLCIRYVSFHRSLCMGLCPKRDCQRRDSRLIRKDRGLSLFWQSLFWHYQSTHEERLSPFDSLSFDIISRLIRKDRGLFIWSASFHTSLFL